MLLARLPYYTVLQSLMLVKSKSDTIQFFRRKALKSRLALDLFVHQKVTLNAFTALIKNFIATLTHVAIKYYLLQTIVPKGFYYLIAKFYCLNSV